MVVVVLVVAVVPPPHTHQPSACVPGVPKEVDPGGSDLSTVVGAWKPDGM